MPGLIGKKLGMTSFFDASGKYVPCTVIEAGPCVVAQVKTKEKDGYEALEGLRFSTKGKPYGVDSLMLPMWNCARPMPRGSRPCASA